MTFISVLIYIFGFIGNITILLYVVGGIAIVLSLILHISFAADYGSTIVDLYNHTFYAQFAKRLWYIIGICAFVLMIVPSQKTLLLIAASEVGQNILKDVSTTPVTQKSIKFLETWLDKETTTLLKEEVKK